MSLWGRERSGRTTVRTLWEETLQLIMSPSREMNPRWVSVCVCVCLRVFLLRRLAGNVSIALWISEKKFYLVIFFLFVCLFVSLDSSICVRYICSIQNNDIQNWSCNIVTVPIYVYESVLLLLFLCWLSGEFLVWSLYEHKFWLCYVIRIAILWWGYR